MRNLGSFFAAAVGLASCFAPAGRLEACTGITLKAENGDVVCARTLEWGESDFESRLLIYPRGYTYHAGAPDGMQGMKWNGVYGVAGLEMFESGRHADAMNEKGLRVGLFYFPGFDDYPAYAADRAGRQIAPSDVVTYLLSTCADVDEARNALENKVEVAAISEPPLGFPPQVHFLISEPSGKQVVVEWAGGKPKFFNCVLGVITNAPTYDWHLINLRNYIGMSLDPKPEISIDGISFSPLGVGSGFLGLPGDFTPPSRFIRAVVFTQSARKTPNGGETLYEAFRILDNFNVPLAKPENAEGKLRSATCWTIAYDMPRHAFYYHTQNDRRVQKIDLEKIGFDTLSKAVILPLDDGRQTVLDRTGEVAAAK